MATANIEKIEINFISLFFLFFLTLELIATSKYSISDNIVDDYDLYIYKHSNR